MKHPAMCINACINTAVFLTQYLGGRLDPQGSVSPNELPSSGAPNNPPVRGPTALTAEQPYTVREDNRGPTESPPQIQSAKPLPPKRRNTKTQMQDRSPDPSVTAAQLMNKLQSPAEPPFPPASGQPQAFDSRQPTSEVPQPPVGKEEQAHPPLK